MTRENAKDLLNKALEEAKALFTEGLFVKGEIEDELDEGGELLSVSAVLTIRAKEDSESEIYVIATACIEEDGTVDDEMLASELADFKDTARIYKARLDAADDKQKEIELIDKMVEAGIKAEIEKTVKDNRQRTIKTAITAAAVMMVIAAICLLIDMLAK